MLGSLSLHGLHNLHHLHGLHNLHRFHGLLALHFVASIRFGCSFALVDLVLVEVVRVTASYQIIVLLAEEEYCKSMPKGTHVIQDFAEEECCNHIKGMLHFRIIFHNLQGQV